MNCCFCSASAFKLDLQVRGKILSEQAPFSTCVARLRVNNSCYCHLLFFRRALFKTTDSLKIRTMDTIGWGVTLSRFHFQFLLARGMHTAPWFVHDSTLGLLINKRLGHEPAEHSNLPLRRCMCVSFEVVSCSNLLLKLLTQSRGGAHGARKIAWRNPGKVSQATCAGARGTGLRSAHRRAGPQDIAWFLA